MSLVTLLRTLLRPISTDYSRVQWPTHEPRGPVHFDGTPCAELWKTLRETR